MAYIDYEQAFPLVSYDYSLKTLKTYKICPRMIRFLGHAMSLRCTRIKYFDLGQPRVTRFLYITNGIFHGESFSALWYCLALNPLSSTLNNTFYGYSEERYTGGYHLTHLLYMDQLKLKHSGVLQLRGSLQSTMKESILDISSKRLSLILRTSFNLANNIKAINSWVLELVRCHRCLFY